MTDMAYFYSHDGDEHGVRFDFKLCNEDTLRETVREHLYPDGLTVPSDESNQFDGVIEELLDSGGCDFEDGWVALKVGTAAIVEFMLSQVRESKAEERYFDNERFKELKRRETAETKYAALCEALIGAIDTKAPALREIAANGGVAA